MPVTPYAYLDVMAGKHVCISYATQRPYFVKWAQSHAQSVMWDNGAFTAFTKGKPMDVEAYYRWLEPMLQPPDWAVIPDVIGGSEEDQRRMLATWPKEVLGKNDCAAVWHLNMPLSYLDFLCNEYPRVCLGSAAEYWKVGSPVWVARMDEVFDFLQKKFRQLPYLHGLRMLSQLGNRWPLASADSANVARNFKSAGKCPGCMSHRIDTINSPTRWRQLAALPVSGADLW